MRRLTDYLVLDFLGGPRPWKFSWIINFQKAGTFVFLLVLARVWLGLFAVSMIMKEASLSRYPEWAESKQRTWWLVPYVL